MRCGICHHPKRAGIEALIAQGINVLDVALRFGVSKTSLGKHVAAHPVVAVQGEIGSLGARADRCSPLGSPARAKIEDVLERIRKLVDQAESDEVATYRDKASLFTAANSSIKLLGQLTGELGASEATVAASPHWKRLRKAILEALVPYPDAAAAVLAVVQRLEGTAA